MPQTNMSFLSSFQQFVNDAGSSISESARKLVNTNSAGSGSRDTDCDDPCDSNLLHLPLSGKSSAASNGGSRRGSRFGLPGLTVPGAGEGGGGFLGVSPIPTPLGSRRGSYNPPNTAALLANSSVLSASASSTTTTSQKRSSSFHGRERKGSRKHVKNKQGSGENAAAARKRVIADLVERQRPKTEPKLCPSYVEVPEKWDEEQTAETGYDICEEQRLLKYLFPNFS